jgi:ABC-2 type transport system permease protein
VTVLYGIVTIARKEVLQLRRATVTLTNTVVFPVVLMVLFCYALSGELRELPTVVVDEDASMLSRQVIAGFENSEQFRITRHAANYTEMERLFKQGRTKLGIFIPRRLEASAARGVAPKIVLVVDGSDSVTASAVLNELSRTVNAVSRDVAVSVAYGPSAPPRAIQFDRHVWFNPDLRDINFIVPGVLGIVLFFFATQVVALEVAKEREVGTMEQLNVTPLRPYELIIGKSLPYLTVFTLEVPILLWIARSMFGATNRGSLVLICAISAIFVVGNIATGLLISSVSATQRDADNLANLVLLPSMLITGALFSFEKMPSIGKAVAELLPLTHYLRAIRAVMLKGVGLEVVWPQVLILVSFCVICFGLSVFSLHKVTG